MTRDLEQDNRDRCILDCDSPSYPPELDEYRQCGCRSCIAELARRCVTLTQERDELDEERREALKAWKEGVEALAALTQAHERLHSLASAAMASLDDAYVELDDRQALRDLEAALARRPTEDK